MNYFFIIFLVTILVTRIFLYIKPVASPTIGGFRMHHYMYGIFGIIFGVFAKSILVYAVGLGLFVDELTYLIIRGKNHADNYSTKSLLGTLFFVILVFIFQKYLISPFV